MSLPAGVRIADQGRRQYVTQRGYFAPPYVSCMFAALCSLLEWAGYRLPLARNVDNTPPENFVLTLHRASGARFENGRPATGTSNAHTQTALKALLPAAPITFSAVTPAEFVQLLEQDYALRFTANCRDFCGLDLPCGCGDIGHAYAAIGTRMVDGIRGIFVFDPMGRPSSFDGQWVRWSAIRAYLNRNADGRIIVTKALKNAAIPPPPPPEPPQGETNVQTLTQVREDEYATIAKGTPLLDPSTLEKRTNTVETADFRIIGRTIDGKYAGVLVNTTRVAGASGLTLLLADATRIGPSFVKDPTAPIVAKVDQAKAIIGNAAKEIAEL